MPQTPKPITKPKLLLGEGMDEINFFNALLAHLGINDIQVDEYGGKYRMRAGLKALASRTGFDQVVLLVVTRDADHADDTNLAIPTAPLIKAMGNPEVSVFILPDNQHAGMLEDVCLAAVSATEADCITTYFDCIERETSRAQLHRNISKSRIHAWLVTQNEPDKRLGEAALASYLNWDHQAFDLLKQFLHQL